MRERRDGACFGLEPPAHLGIGGDVGGHHLDGDFAIEPEIASAIDFPHAAGSERRQDFVLRDAGTGGQAHGSPAAVVSTAR